MSIFPTARFGRALVVAAVVVGVAKIVPFLLTTFSLAGDELTELPPLTPAGTTRSFLLENPITWFLAVAAAVWTVLAVRDLVRHLSSPPPSRRPRPRARTTTRTASTGRPAARRKPAGTAAPRPRAKAAPRSRASATTAQRPKPASARTTTRKAAQPKAAAARRPRTTTTASTTTGRRTSPRR